LRQAGGGAPGFRRTAKLESLRKRLKFRKGDYSAFEDLSSDLRILPSDLGRFLQSDKAEILVDENLNIGILLSSPDAEAADSARLDEAYRRFWNLRDEVRRVLRSPRLEVSDRDQLIEHAEAFNTDENLTITPGSSFFIAKQQWKKRVEELHERVRLR
jgi:hypothetical protein